MFQEICAVLEFEYSLGASSMVHVLRLVFSEAVLRGGFLREVIKLQEEVKVVLMEPSVLPD